MEKNKSLAVQNQSIFYSPDALNHALEVGALLSETTFVPEAFRGKKNIGNCVIALETASRLKINPVFLMQRMYIIKGKPAIEAQLAIALVNMSGRFTPLKFKFRSLGSLKGLQYEDYGKFKTFNGDVENIECVAYATEKSTGEVLESIPVTMEMSVREGWFTKAGSKWRTMPKLMLQYRSGTFFGRVYAPEALAGFQTDNEILDIEAEVIENVVVVPANSLDIDIDNKPDPIQENITPDHDKETGEIIEKPSEKKVVESSDDIMPSEFDD